MTYILVTDLHGNLEAYDILRHVLAERGWVGLEHPNETLIVMGDSSDRGEGSLFLHQTFSQSSSVVHLMGNHDYNIIRWHEGASKHFHPTREQLESNTLAAKQVVDAVMEYPYRFIGKGFVAAHAYPFGNDREAIYGLTEKQVRIPWWEDYSLQPHATFFGHYHAEGDMMWPEKRLYCLDNLDVGLFTYAVVKDGKEEIHSIQM